jgi:hypothetical protein
VSTAEGFRADERPAAREEEGTPSAVLTVERAEDLAARTRYAIEAQEYGPLPSLDHYTADWARVKSDLAGLREHDSAHYAMRGDGCVTCLRYSDGLRRMAALYGVTP